mmetsp:Transcript_27921/g.39261  ORF Transcript_27921/g.39261 Transcript_27921/m.39261 type:complete len:333 (+) Transcript_27921:341-1339(+)
MPPPSLCGPFISSKRSLVAFAWTIANVLTFFCFFIASVKIAHIHSHYRYLQHQAAYNNNNDDYNNDNDNNDDENNYNLRHLLGHVVMRMVQEGEGGEEQDRSHDSHDDENKENIYELLSSTQSRSMAFVAIYTMILAMGINMYGTTAIVGFTSLRGDYIAPCFSGGDEKQSKIRTGMFGGAIIVFANLLLLCAVIFGEVRVEDYRDKQRENNENEDHELEPYAVERIATVLGVAAMFLSVLYMFFAILLFVCHHGTTITNFTAESDEMLSSILMSAGGGGAVGGNGGGAGDDDNMVGGVMSSEDHLSSVVRNRSHGANAGFITMEESNSVDG